MHQISPHRVLSQRIRLFVLIAAVLIAMSKLLYLRGVTFPNLELIIPTLVVVGSLSLPCGSSAFWRRFTRYFGIIALFSVFIIDVVFWGLLPIYVFTWSGFVFCWLLGTRNKLSPFDGFRKLLGHTLLTGATAILLFDFWTGIIGVSLEGWYGPATSLATWATAFFAQIPFTFYHLCSLVFIPPLVGLVKLLVKIPVPVAIPIKASVSSSEWR